MNASRGERRVALVVGNGKYQKTSWLANPPNDAEKMAAALGRLGFDVFDGINLDFASFAGRVRDFGRALRDAHVALFFFAGHGLQVGGENYVVPVDAALEHEADVQLELIAVQTILASMEVGNRTSIVILDACRDNPLARNLARAMGTTRSMALGEGLGRLESGIGSYIAFATSPNKVALDGTGTPNSPFTTALLKHIETPGATITEVMMRVRGEVIKATQNVRQGPQVPWEHSSLLAPFYFKPPQSAPTQNVSSSDPTVIIDRAERDWQRFEIATTEHIPTIEAYISEYVMSEPLWAARARQRLEVMLALGAERVEKKSPERPQPPVAHPQTKMFEPTNLLKKMIETISRTKLQPRANIDIHWMPIGQVVNHAKRRESSRQWGEALDAAFESKVYTAEVLQEMKVLLMLIDSVSRMTFELQKHQEIFQSNLQYVRSQIEEGLKQLS